MEPLPLPSKRLREYPNPLFYILAIHKFGFLYNRNSIHEIPREDPG
jgi:hypothetical protein